MDNMCKGGELVGKAKKLKAYRKLLGISAQEMANALSINISTYCNKENGKAVFDLKESKIISEKIGKTVDEIFFNDEVTL